jgi:hypothetical protein
MGQSKRGLFSKGRVSIVAINYRHIQTFKSYIYYLIFASLIFTFKWKCPQRATLDITTDVVSSGADGATIRASMRGPEPLGSCGIVAEPLLSPPQQILHDRTSDPNRLGKPKQAHNHGKV